MKKQSQLTTAVTSSRAVKIKQAAVLLGICENSVRRLIDREKLRTVRVLRHHLIPLDEIDKFLAGDK